MSESQEDKSDLLVFNGKSKVFKNTATQKEVALDSNECEGLRTFHRVEPVSLSSISGSISSKNSSSSKE